jgi:hypothetical protein
MHRDSLAHSKSLLVVSRVSVKKHQSFYDQSDGEEAEVTGKKTPNDDSDFLGLKHDSEREQARYLRVTTAGANNSPGNFYDDQNIQEKEKARKGQPKADNFLTLLDPPLPDLNGFELKAGSHSNRSMKQNTEQRASGRSGDRFIGTDFNDWIDNFMQEPVKPLEKKRSSSKNLNLKSDLNFGVVRKTLESDNYLDWKNSDGSLPRYRPSEHAQNHIDFIDEGVHKGSITKNPQLIGNGRAYRENNSNSQNLTNLRNSGRDHQVVPETGSEYLIDFRNSERLIDKKFYENKFNQIANVKAKDPGNYDQDFLQASQPRKSEQLQTPQARRTTEEHEIVPLESSDFEYGPRMGGLGRKSKAPTQTNTPIDFSKLRDSNQQGLLIKKAEPNIVINLKRQGDHAPDTYENFNDSEVESNNHRRVSNEPEVQIFKKIGLSASQVVIIDKEENRFNSQKKHFNDIQGSTPRKPQENFDKISSLLKEDLRFVPNNSSRINLEVLYQNQEADQEMKKEAADTYKDWKPNHTESSMRINEELANYAPVTRNSSFSNNYMNGPRMSPKAIDEMNIGSISKYISPDDDLNIVLPESGTDESNKDKNQAARESRAKRFKSARSPEEVLIGPKTIQYGSTPENPHNNHPETNRVTFDTLNSSQIRQLASQYITAVEESALNLADYAHISKARMNNNKQLEQSLNDKTPDENSLYFQKESQNQDIIVYENDYQPFNNENPNNYVKQYISDSIRNDHNNGLSGIFFQKKLASSNIQKDNRGSNNDEVDELSIRSSNYNFPQKPLYETPNSRHINIMDISHNVQYQLPKGSKRENRVLSFGIESPTYFQQGSTEEVKPLEILPIQFPVQTEPRAGFGNFVLSKELIIQRKNKAREMNLLRQPVKVSSSQRSLSRKSQRNSARQEEKDKAEAQALWDYQKKHQQEIGLNPKRDTIQSSRGFSKEKFEKQIMDSKKVVKNSVKSKRYLKRENEQDIKNIQKEKTPSPAKSPQKSTRITKDGPSPTKYLKVTMKTQPLPSRLYSKSPVKHVLKGTTPIKTTRLDDKQVQGHPMENVSSKHENSQSRSPDFTELQEPKSKMQTSKAQPQKKSLRKDAHLKTPGDTFICELPRGTKNEKIENNHYNRPKSKSPEVRQLPIYVNLVKEDQSRVKKVIKFEEKGRIFADLKDKESKSPSPTKPSCNIVEEKTRLYKMREKISRLKSQLEAEVKEKARKEAADRMPSSIDYYKEFVR